MNNLFLSIVFLVSSLTYSAQFVAELQLDAPVEGICNMKHIYSLFPSFEGQVEAVPPLSIDELKAKLTTEVHYLKENPKTKTKGMISLLVNCKGEVVQCEMDTKTKSNVLDQQLVAFFRNLGIWEAGKLDGNAVDSSILFAFTIKKGVVSFE